VSELGWAFRTRPLEYDYGIDGDVDIFEDNKATGKTFAVQIKTGKSFVDKLRNGHPQKIPIPRRTARYWLEYRLPVFLFAVDDLNKVVYWTLASDQAQEQLEKSSNGISVEVNNTHVLDDSAITRIIDTRERYLDSQRIPPIPPNDHLIRSLPGFREISDFKQMVVQKEDDANLLLAKSLGMVRSVQLDSEVDFQKFGLRIPWPKEFFENAQSSTDFSQVARKFAVSINQRENRYFIDKLLKCQKSNESLFSEFSTDSVEQLINELENPSKTLYLFSNIVEFSNIEGSTFVNGANSVFGYSGTVTIDNFSVHNVAIVEPSPETPFTVLFDPISIGIYEVKQPIRIDFRTLRPFEWTGILDNPEKYLEAEGSKITRFRIINPTAGSAII
jgi:hypothetical protein